VHVHDRVFRELLQQPDAVEALLHERLPPRTVARFAGPPELLPGTFVDEAFRSSAADVLVRVPLVRGETAWIYCLIEHKRTSEARVFLQLLRYLAAIYAKLGKRYPPGDLPVVVPLVVYNGVRRWSGPRRFSELLSADRATRRLTLDFPAIFVDLQREPAETLSSHPVLRGGLLGLKVAAVSPRRQKVLIPQTLRVLAVDPPTQRLFVRYLNEVAAPTALPVLQRAMKDATQEAQTVQTIATYLRSLGYRQGHRKGIAKGRAETLRTNLSALLKQRFDRIPREVSRRVATAEAAQLDAWFTRALGAKKLADVFAPH